MFFYYYLELILGIFGVFEDVFKIKVELILIKLIKEILR